MSPNPVIRQIADASRNDGLDSIRIPSHDPIPRSIFSLRHTVWTHLLITVGFLAIPVLWGIAVNGLFDLWSGRENDETEDDGVFPDYQI